MLSDEDIKALGRDAFGIDPTFDGNLMRYARAVERAAYERAAQECRVICSKNHADAATFKNGTKAYVQACDDCDDAIRALKSEGA